MSSVVSPSSPATSDVSTFAAAASLVFASLSSLPGFTALPAQAVIDIAIDAVNLKEYGEKLAVRIKELETRIYQEAGEEFNINSPKQMGVILFEKLGLKGGKKTKTGYSTAADILEKLAPE